jgi:hypothetical protein
MLAQKRDAFAPHAVGILSQPDQMAARMQLALASARNG